MYGENFVKENKMGTQKYACSLFQHVYSNVQKTSALAERTQTSAQFLSVFFISSIVISRAQFQGTHFLSLSVSSVRDAAVQLYIPSSYHLRSYSSSSGF